MYKIKCLYREFTSFEGSLFKYSLSFSLLLALAPSLLIFALMFKFAYLDDTIILNFYHEFYTGWQLGNDQSAVSVFYE